MSASNPDKHRQAMEVLCELNARSSSQTSLLLGMNTDLTSLQSLAVGGSYISGSSPTPKPRQTSTNTETRWRSRL